jgi:hypothetical protein
MQGGLVESPRQFGDWGTIARSFDCNRHPLDLFCPSFIEVLWHFDLVGCWLGQREHSFNCKNNRLIGQSAGIAVLD